MVNLSLNGNKIVAPPGATILEVAKASGVSIPTLCYLEGQPPMGACRLCVVEVEGSRNLVGSCHTPVNEGMAVQTHSPKVIDARRTIVELLLSSHPDTCLVCDKANICELRAIAADLEVGLPRYRAQKHYFPIEADNAYILRDMGKCIHCRRCVVACKNIKGKNLFSVAYRGFDTKIIYGLDQPVEAQETCQGCDVCVSLCPSEALMKPRKIGEERATRALYVKGK
jgi:NADH dehydrogenase/NADH:ubiquinone oxidoreductase subunit G